MDRIAVAGISLRRAALADVELFARPTSARASGFLHGLADVLGASELLFLATCNRVEVLYARETGQLPGRDDVRPLLEALVPEGELERLQESTHLYTGFRAARYMFRVAASLESLVVGEDQIVAQLREAVRAADDSGLIGSLLRPLLDQTFRLAKRVRTETELARIPVSVVSLAVERVAGECDGPLTVGVLGAGKMGALLVRALQEAELGPHVVANRSAEPARRLAEPIGARAVSLDELRAGEVAVDALFAATAAPEVVLDADALTRLAERTPGGGPLHAVDLSLPRNLASTSDERVRLIDLESLRRSADANRKRREREALRAEELIEAKLKGLARRRSGPLVEELLAELRANSDDLFSHALGELFTGRLAALDDSERRAVERWARGTFGRLKHLPISALRRLAERQPAGHDLSGDARETDSGVA